MTASKQKSSKSGEITSKVEDIVEAGKKINEEFVEPVRKYVNAKNEQKSAEKQSRINQRAAEIKNKHPKVSADMAIKHAKNEEEAGMLRE